MEFFSLSTQKGRHAPLISILFGSFLFGLAYNLFLEPGGIIVGGFTGIATLLHLLFGWDSGLLVLLLNLPFLIWCGIRYGVRFAVRSVVGVGATSAALSLLTFLPVSLSDPLLCAALGGAVMGVGCGLLLHRGYTTGGSDLVAALLRSTRPDSSVGQLVVVVDTVIVLVSAIVLRNFSTTFYSLIAIFAFGRGIAFAAQGANSAALLAVFTEHPKALCDFLLHTVGRGVTVLDAVGGFSQAPKKVLLCVVTNAESQPLRRLISQKDPDAFFVLCPVSYVMGQGFVPTQL